MNKINIKLTQEEIKSIIDYTGISHKQINSLLSSDLLNEYSYLLDSSFYFPLYEQEESLNKDIDQILLMYSAMVKMSYLNDISNYRLYRGTSSTNIKQNRMGFISTTFDKNMAKHYFTSSFKDNNKVLLNIKLNSNVPHFIMNNTEEYGNNYENEVILSPFLNLNYKNKTMSDNISCYDLELSKIDLIDSDISLDDINIIREEAINNLKELVDLKREEADLYYRYMYIQNQLSRVSSEERKNLLSDFDCIDKYLNELSKTIKEKETIYLEFKNEVQSYIQKECLKIEKNIENEINNNEEFDSKKYK